MKAILKVIFALFFVFSCCNIFAQEKKITLLSLLNEMTDFDAVTRYPAPSYILKQVSSYDRRSISPDKPGWFANNDYNQFIKSEKKWNHTEYVMMDADGPGVIVRFWLTTLVKPGILRFYFDNEKKASIEIPAFDLLKGFKLGTALLNPHSSYEPEGKGGSTLYLPLPYKRHCKITWQFNDSNTLNQPHYYQINYRTYTTGTDIESFKLSLLEKYKTAIDKTEALLWNPVIKTGRQMSLDKVLPSNNNTSLLLPQGPGAVRTLIIKANTNNSSNQEKLWRSLFIKIEFDGRETVMCPVGDFIGSGYGGYKIKSWYRDLNNNGELTCRWVMPYQESARIYIINKNPFDVYVNVSAITGVYKWNKNTMYFHATYKYEENIKDAKWDYDINKIASNDPLAPIDWNFVSISGKGVYMGNTLSVNNHMNTWYGEGDAKAYVDKETFPSEFGTGLEDYYNTSWAPVTIYQTPFANAPRADHPSSKGFNTFTRTRDLDAIPFTNNFSFDMEMLSWDGGTIDAAATTYWYGFADAGTE